MLCIAHRGASGHYPEHSKQAFLLAIDMQVDAIEFDIQMSKDKQPIILHDSNLERVSNGIGLVKNHTLKNLKKFTLNNHEPILTLDEVLELLVLYKGILKLDVKVPNLHKQIVSLLKKYNRLSDIIITTEIPKILKDYLILVPNLKTEINCIEEPLSPEEFIRFAKEWNTSHLAPRVEVVTQEHIAIAHQHNIQIHVWNVTRKEEVHNLKQWHADGITTDFPELVRNTTHYKNF